MWTTNQLQSVPLAAAPGEGSQPGLTLIPVRQSLLLNGTSGGGKSTLTTGLLERLAEHDFQFAALDPEGDYETLNNALSVGLPELAPSTEDVLQVLQKTSASVVVNLLGVAPEDRPGYFDGLLPELLALRERTGRPHFVVVDEAHHMLPATWDPGATALPSGLKGFMFITVRPETLSPRTLEYVDRAIAVGEQRGGIAGRVRPRRGIAEPTGPMQIERGQLLSLSVGHPIMRCWTVIPGKTERRRHARKYAEGKLGDDKAFYFRGSDGRLNLRATNLTIFLEMADGVDEATWAWHRDGGDFSTWVESCNKDTTLAEELRQVESAGTSSREAIVAVRQAVERRYILPA